MLDLIVRTSSNPESIVLDFFCGSGTTAVAAMRNGRKWIAIDQSDAAIAVAKKKLGFAEGHGADSGRCEFIDFSVHSSNPKTTPPMRYPEQNDKGQMLLAMEQEAKYHARPRRKLAKNQPYSKRGHPPLRHLNIRTFDWDTRLETYERKHGLCAMCRKHFELDEMHADHITPWREGGRTIAANCQMLCRDCNRRKGAK